MTETRLEMRSNYNSAIAFCFPRGVIAITRGHLVATWAGVGGQIRDSRLSTSPLACTYPCGYHAKHGLRLNKTKYYAPIFLCSLCVMGVCRAICRLIIAGNAAITGFGGQKREEVYYKRHRDGDFRKLQRLLCPLFSLLFSCIIHFFSYALWVGDPVSKSFGAKAPKLFETSEPNNFSCKRHLRCR